MIFVSLYDPSKILLLQLYLESLSHETLNRGQMQICLLQNHHSFSIFIKGVKQSIQ